MPLSTVDEAIDQIRAGKCVIVVDDEDRENEGDLIVAAEKVTPDIINFMATHGRGLICMPLEGKRLDELQVPMMVQRNSTPQGTAFAVSIEAKNGTTTGISASDRAATVLAVLDPNTRPDDISMPGHMFPLRARPGGVLERSGHTEAAVDLARLAGLYPAGVICEIMNEDGTMARFPELQLFGKKHDIRLLSIAQLIAYRRRSEKLVQRVAEAQLPTRWGQFTTIAYKSQVDADQHVALVMGDLSGPEPVLTRVHSQCLTGDVFGSLRCDCGDQMAVALERIAAEGRGVFLYMRQEGRGIGLHNKIMAYALQDQGMDTVEANVALGFPPDPRQYGVGAQILVDLGLTQIRLLTNNPTKRVGLESYGLTVVDQMSIVTPVTTHNRRYIEAKRDKLGHLIPIE
jgi:3,4-dihydroxy 2-butanone 4-phosphate synthase/GTP cyclohydrolase II